MEELPMLFLGFVSIIKMTQQWVKKFVMIYIYFKFELSSI